MHEACSYCLVLKSRWRQLFGRAPYDFERRSGGCFGCRHHCTLYHRCVTYNDAATPRFRQHLDCHFAVGFGSSQIDQDRDALLRPRLVDGRHDRLDIGAKSAIRISTAPAEWHFAADHLLHHQRSAPGDVRRVRHDDDSYVFTHAKPSMTSATASTINALDREPGSM